MLLLILAIIVVVQCTLPVLRSVSTLVANLVVILLILFLEIYLSLSIIFQALVSLLLRLLWYVWHFAKPGMEISVGTTGIVALVDEDLHVLALY